MIVDNIYLHIIFEIIFFLFLIAFTHQSLAVGLARIGCDDQHIVACSLQDMIHVDLGSPLHCLVIPAEKLHPLETEFLTQYALDKNHFKEMI